jgi:hypothetical protein
MDPWTIIRLAWWLKDLNNTLGLIMMTRSVLWSNQPQFGLCFLLLCHKDGFFISWMSRTRSCMVFLRRKYT